MKQPHPLPPDHCPINKEPRAGANWPFAAPGTLGARAPRYEEDTEGAKFCRALTCQDAGPRGRVQEPALLHPLQVGRHWPRERAASAPQGHKAEAPAVREHGDGRVSHGSESWEGLVCSRKASGGSGAGLSRLKPLRWSVLEHLLRAP